MVILKECTGEIQKLVGLNYSSGGIAINSSKPLSAGDQVELLFWLTEPEYKEVNMRAEVLHFTKNGNEYTNSLKFINELPPTP